MIRTCIGRVTLTSNRFTGAAIRFISTEPTRTRSKEIRDVKIIGNIYQDPLTFDNGNKVITVKTMQPDNHFKLHRALITNQKMLNIIGDNLTKGQRVYISGELRSDSFKNSENHNRQRITIHVNELYASKAAGNVEVTKYTDCNSAFLLSHIVSNINHNDNFSQFYMSSNVEVRNPIEGGETHKLAFYNIYVHDRNLIDYVKENLRKKDRIFVNGLLSYKPDTDQNGAKAYGGYIEASNILKINRFSEISNENPIEENIKSVGE